MIALVEPESDAQLRCNRRALAVVAASADPRARNRGASLDRPGEERLACLERLGR